MTKRICTMILLGMTLICASGCSILSAALSAGAAYGIYRATH